MKKIIAKPFFEIRDQDGESLGRAKTRATLKTTLNKVLLKGADVTTTYVVRVEPLASKRVAGAPDFSEAVARVAKRYPDARFSGPGQGTFVVSCADRVCRNTETSVLFARQVKNVVHEHTRGGRTNKVSVRHESEVPFSVRVTAFRLTLGR